MKHERAGVLNSVLCLAEAQVVDSSQVANDVQANVCNALQAALDLASGVGGVAVVGGPDAIDSGAERAQNSAGDVGAAEDLTNTLGNVFNGAYVPGDVLGSFGGDIASIWNNNYKAATASTKDQILSGMKGVLNVGLNIVGNLAAIYNMGFGTAKNIVNDTYGDETKFEF